jgi:hypothetical protein
MLRPHGSGSGVTAMMTRMATELMTKSRKSHWLQRTQMSLLQIRRAAETLRKPSLAVLWNCRRCPASPQIGNATRSLLIKIVKGCDRLEPQVEVRGTLQPTSALQFPAIIREPSCTGGLQQLQLAKYQYSRTTSQTLPSIDDHDKCAE